MIVFVVSVEVRTSFPDTVRVPTMWSAVEGVVVPTPTRLLTESTNNVPESIFMLPEAVKVPVVVRAVAVTVPATSSLLFGVVVPTPTLPPNTVTVPLAWNKDNGVVVPTPTLPVDPVALGKIRKAFAVVMGTPDVAVPQTNV